MTKLKTLIVDDEPLAQELVAGYVSRVGELELIGCCSTASEALEFLDREQIDLLFLDVQMPGMSGLTLAKRLTDERRPKIVFTTAYEEYAVDGFRVDAIDYLLKPFDFDEFMRAVSKVLYLTKLQQNAKSGDVVDYFFVKSEYKLVKIEIDKLLYLEGLKDYVKIYLEEQARPVLTLSTMKQMETNLQNHPFVRVHKSYIVNMRKIVGVEKSNVVIGLNKIPIGDGYRARFMAAMDKKIF